MPSSKIKQHNNDNNKNLRYIKKIHQNDLQTAKLIWAGQSYDACKMTCMIRHSLNKMFIFIPVTPNSPAAVSALQAIIKSEWRSEQCHITVCYILNASIWWKKKFIHRKQIWRTTRSLCGTSCMKVRLVRPLCFVWQCFPWKVLLRGWSSLFYFAMPTSFWVPECH